MADDLIFGGDQVTADDLTPSQGGNYATMPYIGLAKLMDVNGESPSKKEEKKDMEALQFVFELQEGEEKGATYRKVEFPPTTQDQANNMLKRVAHILVQFMPGDKEANKAKALKALDSKGWQEFKKKVLEIFNTKLTKEKYQAKKDLSIKLLGRIVSQGKHEGEPDFGFPGYLGFISDSRSEEPLKFQTNEAKNNNAYVHMLLSAPKNKKKDEDEEETPDFGDDISGDTNTPAPAETSEEEELEF